MSMKMIGAIVVILVTIWLGVELTNKSAQLGETLANTMREKIEAVNK